MIVVTGGAGFIGSSLIWKLNCEGITDILVVDNIGSTEKWQNLVPLQVINYYHKASFLDMLRSGQFDGNIEAIFHLGACSATTEKDMDYLVQNNLHYTQTLAKYCLSHNIYFQYASSAATYGDGSLGFSDHHDTVFNLRPINRYGYSKQLFDALALKNGWLNHIVGLKFFNVFGPNEYHKGSMRSVVCKAYDQIMETGQLNLFKSYRQDYAHGEQKRDFVYVKDCVNLMWSLYQTPSATGLFNIGTGKAVSWNTLAEAVFKAMKKPVRINYIEMPEGLREQYQYFTEAETAKVELALGKNHSISEINEAIQDYIPYLPHGARLSRLQH